MSTRILLADDHKIMREGLASLIRAQSHYELVGEASTGVETLEKARAMNPHMVVMDISMPGMNGIEVTRRLAAEMPHVKVVALSIYHDKHYIIEMFRAGAVGFLPKDAAFHELLTALCEVAAGRQYLSPQITRDVLQDFLAQTPHVKNSSYTILTAREREVLQRIAEGVSTKEIATALKISVRTVETFRRQIMNKLDLHSVAELTKYAIREGITGPD